MFCIGEFTGVGDRKEIAVVQKNWLQNGKCYWPPFWKNSTRFISALKHGKRPNPQEWLLYECRVVGGKFYGSYEEARKHLNMAQERSDLSAEEHIERLRKRKRPNHKSDTSSETSDPPFIGATPGTGKSKRRKGCARKMQMKIPPPPRFPAKEISMPWPTLVAVSDISEEVEQMAHGVMQTQGNDDVDYGQEIGETATFNTNFAGQVTPNSLNNGNSVPEHNLMTITTELPFSTSTVYQFPNVEEVNGSFPGVAASPLATPGTKNQLRDFVNDSDISGHPIDMRNFVKTTQRNQELILAKLDVVMDLCTTMLRGKQLSHGIVQPSSSLSLPFDTLLAFREFENEMKRDKDKRETLVTAISVSGGNTPNQVVHRVMMELMTDGLMQQFTFKGQTGKESFYLSGYFSCVFVRRHPMGQVMTKKAVEDATDYWLRKAALRVEKKQKKKENRSILETSADGL